MEVDILTLIGNYAFPVAMCVALFWKLDKDQKTNQESAERRDQLHREDAERRDQLHREETAGLRASLDNNTAAINALAQTINANK